MKKIQKEVWTMFAEIAIKLIDHKMINEIELSALEVKMYHMSKNELAESDNEDIIEYINDITPFIIWDTLDEEKDDEPMYEVGLC